MAEFEPAYEKTMGHEGGYSNDPEDKGGETYKGISRVKNPTSRVWTVIDAMKSSGMNLDNLNDNENMQSMVRAFYKHKYWDSFNGDEFDSQKIAEEMFDSGVNCGTGSVNRWLQQSLNLLNRDGDLFAELVVDGGIGKVTLSALDRLTYTRDRMNVFKLLNAFQIGHYIKHNQDRFIRGWLKRVTI
jgi:lysozyme family protein